MLKKAITVIWIGLTESFREVLEELLGVRFPRQHFVFMESDTVEGGRLLCMHDPRRDIVVVDDHKVRSVQGASPLRLVSELCRRDTEDGRDCLRIAISDTEAVRREYCMCGCQMAYERSQVGEGLVQAVSERAYKLAAG